MVGDSFGWAGGLEGNYTALLETMFERRDGSHKIDVINTGYPGTHTGEQLVVLKKYGLQYNPDLVILAFFAGNDFFEADPNRKRIVVNGCLVDIDKRHEHRFLGYPVITRSRALVFLKQNTRFITGPKRLWKREKNGPPQRDNQHFLKTCPKLLSLTSRKPSWTSSTPKPRPNDLELTSTIFLRAFPK